MEPLGLVSRSLKIAAGLCVLKAAVGIQSNSLGILASALDSLMDLGSSAINYVSLQIARSPADRDHPYGRGKAEALAGLFQSVFIGLSGLALLAEAFRRFWFGAMVHAGLLSLGVMVLGTVVSAFHGRSLKRAAARENSTVLRAEGVHFAMDVLSNLGVLAALIAVRLSRNPLWDVAISGLISAYILFESSRILRDSVLELMDRGLPPAVQSQIEEMILGHHPNLVGFHEFRSRKAGNRTFIDFHIEIRGIQSFEEAHDITESLIEKIKAKTPNCDVTVHYDPEGAR